MDPSMLVAITGFIVGVGGIVLNVRGMRDQHRQQGAATRAIADKGRLEEIQQVLDARAEDLDRANTREQQLLVRADKLVERIQTLEDENEEQRLLHRSQVSRQEALCREQHIALTEALVTLRAVVVDEIAMASAATVLDRQLPHPHEPPELENP
jgi:hypothetical protein